MPIFFSNTHLPDRALPLRENFFKDHVSFEQRHLFSHCFFPQNLFWSAYCFLVNAKLITSVVLSLLVQALLMRGRCLSLIVWNVIAIVILVVMFVAIVVPVVMFVLLAQLICWLQALRPLDLRQ